MVRLHLKVGLIVWCLWDDGILYKAEIKNLLLGSAVMVEFLEDKVIRRVSLGSLEQVLPNEKQKKRKKPTKRLVTHFKKVFFSTY